MSTPLCSLCNTHSDYPHDSVCGDCGAHHAHPGTRECVDRHACDVRWLTDQIEELSIDHQNTVTTLDARVGADRDLVRAVDVLLTRIVAAASDGHAIPEAVLQQHDVVRRLITSDLYQSMLGIRL